MEDFEITEQTTDQPVVEDKHLQTFIKYHLHLKDEELLKVREPLGNEEVMNELRPVILERAAKWENPQCTKCSENPGKHWQEDEWICNECYNY